MQGDHKEQNGYHSLNRWKERLALQHRHAEMSTGSKPCILRGILNKGPQALMARLGPSHGERTRDTAHKIVSEFSVHNEVPVRICYIQCVQLKSGQIYQFIHHIQRFYQCYKMRSMVRAMAQYHIHQGECSYQQASGPMLSVYIM